MRRGQLQSARKLIQLSSLGFIVYTALSMYWRNFKVSHNSSRLVGLMTNEVWAKLYHWNEVLLSTFGDPMSVSEGFLGGPWSATVAGVPLTDPASAAALAASGQLPPAALLLGMLLPIGLAVVGGKLFCSFLCPARLLFEAAGSVRQGLLRLGVPLPEWQLPRIGLWVGLGAVLAAASAGTAVFHFVLPYLALSSAIQAGVIGGVFSATGAAFAGMLLVDALLAPGQICRSLCPTGALLELLGRRSALRLARLDDEACPSACSLCQRACPYGLFPARGHHRSGGCDACGRCSAVCPAQRLGHRLEPFTPEGT